MHLFPVPMTPESGAHSGLIYLHVNLRCVFTVVLLVFVSMSQEHCTFFQILQNGCSELPVAASLSSFTMGTKVSYYPWVAAVVMLESVLLLAWTSPATVCKNLTSRKHWARDDLQLREEYGVWLIRVMLIFSPLGPLAVGITNLILIQGVVSRILTRWCNVEDGSTGGASAPPNFPTSYLSSHVYSVYYFTSYVDLLISRVLNQCLVDETRSVPRISRWIQSSRRGEI